MADKPPVEKRTGHMAQRKAAGLTYKEVAGEFGTSKSTAHRKVGKMIQQGYTKLGKA